MRLLDRLMTIPSPRNPCSPKRWTGFGASVFQLGLIRPIASGHHLQDMPKTYGADFFSSISLRVKDVSLLDFNRRASSIPIDSN